MPISPVDPNGFRFMLSNASLVLKPYLIYMKMAILAALVFAVFYAGTTYQGNKDQVVIADLQHKLALKDAASEWANKAQEDRKELATAVIKKVTEDFDAWSKRQPARTQTIVQQFKPDPKREKDCGTALSEGARNAVNLVIQGD